MKTSKGIGKVLEFAGEDLKNWPMDERATLTNMSVEAGGTTGIIEPDERTLEYIVSTRDSMPAKLERASFTAILMRNTQLTLKLTWMRSGPWCTAR